MFISSRLLSKHKVIQQLHNIIQRNKLVGMWVVSVKMRGCLLFFALNQMYKKYF